MLWERGIVLLRVDTTHGNATTLVRASGFVAPPSRRLSWARLAPTSEGKMLLRRAQGRLSRQPAEPALSEVEGMPALHRHHKGVAPV